MNLQWTPELVQLFQACVAAVAVSSIIMFASRRLTDWLIEKNLFSRGRRKK